MSNPYPSPTPGRLVRIVHHILAAIAALAVVTLAVGVHMAASGLIILAFGHLVVVGLAYLLVRHRDRARSADR
jgi:hypothetical protein